MRRDWLEDEANAERWMISYADFITLLFAFFVVMYAISSVNDEKYKVLSDTLARAFEVEARTPDPIQIGEPSLRASPHVIDIPHVQGTADDTYGDTFVEDTAETVTDQGGFSAGTGQGVRVDNDWLEFDLDADVLFSAGSAELAPRAADLIRPLTDELLRNDNPITIEGYTDNIPSSGERYPSNWELSAARASSVARFLVSLGVDADRLAAIGYGENHPLATNGYAARACYESTSQYCCCAPQSASTQSKCNAEGNRKSAER